MFKCSHLHVHLAVECADSGDRRDGGDTGVSGYFPVVVAELALVVEAASAEAAAPTAVRTGAGVPVND